MYFNPPKARVAADRSSNGSCVYLGDVVLDSDGKQIYWQCRTCKGNVRLKVFHCGHAGRGPEATTTTRGCAECSLFTEEIAATLADDFNLEMARLRGGLIESVAPLPSIVHPRLAIDPKIPAMSIVGVKQLVRDAARFAGRLDPTIDCVVGIARSGMVPATVIATHLDLRLFSVSRTSGLLYLGHGERLGAEARDAELAPYRHVLIVDDTIYSGREMAFATQLVLHKFQHARLTKAAIYAFDGAPPSIDLCMAEHAEPIYWDWHWFNSEHVNRCAFDFDGILCDVPEPWPLYLPRTHTIPLIVSGRHEASRKANEQWLSEHGASAKSMILRDWDLDPDGDENEQIGRWKAGIYRDSELTLFAESEIEQATIIAGISGKQVICPSLGRVIGGASTTTEEDTFASPTYPRLRDPSLPSGQSSRTDRT